MPKPLNQSQRSEKVSVVITSDCRDEYKYFSEYLLILELYIKV